MSVSRRDLFCGGVANVFAHCCCVAAARPADKGPNRNSMSNDSKASLLTAPIELAGNWGKMLPASADDVVELMRRVCLDDLRLVSDRQPSRIRVDEHPSGTPAIWLHSDPANTAWVIVDVGQRAWSQLSYQFGHELGHVLANSWQANATPGPPNQWLEEAMVEAFSLRGLGRLARRWKQAPPFPGDNAYGDAIWQYRQDMVQRYQLAAQEGDLTAWFHAHKSEIERGQQVSYGPPASIILAQYERSPKCVEALGALNRWPGRTHIPIAQYFRAWEASCVGLGASLELPAFLKSKLQIE